MKDDDGLEIKEGDTISFSYGIPPVGVKAPVVSRNGELMAITKGHNPPECSLKQLKKYVGNIYLVKGAKP